MFTPLRLTLAREEGRPRDHELGAQFKSVVYTVSRRRCVFGPHCRPGAWARMAHWLCVGLGILTLACFFRCLRSCHLDDSQKFPGHQICTSENRRSKDLQLEMRKIGMLGVIVGTSALKWTKPYEHWDKPPAN